jgi:hypothetical protein
MLLEEHFRLVTFEFAGNDQSRGGMVEIVYSCGWALPAGGEEADFRSAAESVARIVESAYLRLQRAVPSIHVRQETPAECNANLFPQGVSILFPLDQATSP